jgi:cytoskeletal protein RodZ
MNPTESIPPPNPPEKDRQVARANAQKVLARRRRHIQIIRKRAIVGSVAVFAAAWVAIGFQLVSGHDPALSKSSQAAVVASTSSGGTKTSSDKSSSSKQSSAKSSSASSSTSASQQLAPVTTQQS